METRKHRVNLQLPTLVPIAITVDTQHNVTFLAEHRLLRLLIVNATAEHFHNTVFLCADLHLQSQLKT